MMLIEAKTVIGMDVGKKYSWCEAMDVESGTVMREKKLGNRPEEFISFAAGLPKPIRLVMEASGNWGYLYECWEGLADEIQMAHPLKTKAIASARIKTDRIDMHILAQLGRADLVPQAYTPGQAVRDIRELLRHRAFLVGLSTRIKNRIHAYLWKLGIQTESSDLFGKAGLTWLKGLELRKPFKNLVEQDLKILETVGQEVKRATHEIERLAAVDVRTALLFPMRGLGKYSVMLILAEIGEIERFPDSKKLVSYAGLCPSTYQSGNVLRHGRITKQGSRWLRWILIEAAQKYAKVPGRLGDYYRRVARSKGTKTARTALAREMLTVIYYCLKKGVKFEENPQQVNEQKRTRSGLSQHASPVSGRN